MREPSVVAAIAAVQRTLERTLGFSPEAIASEALARALARRCPDLDARARFVEAVLTEEPATLAWLESVVTVGETYFFRHPEHFDLIATQLVPRLLTLSDRLHAWSAGCSTGEETWSLAACLQDAVPPSFAVEVVGTDVVPERLACAARGEYARWSLRSERAVRCVDLLDGSKARVRPSLRTRTRFVEHNLLTRWPGSPSQFELVLCRNVLAYMGPDARRRVLGNLVAALVPGGALVLGPLDVDAVPPELSRLESAGANVLLKPLEVTKPTPAPVIAAPVPPPPPVSPPPVPEVTAGRVHADAVHALEAGELERAAALLARLLQRWPDYLPALCELALVERRLGRQERSATLMREVARRADALAGGEVVDGMEPSTAEYYRRTASAFFGQGERRR